MMHLESVDLEMLDLRAQVVYREIPGATTSYPVRELRHPSSTRSMLMLSSFVGVIDLMVVHSEPPSRKSSRRVVQQNSPCLRIWSSGPPTRDKNGPCGNRFFVDMLSSKGASKI